MAEIERIPAVPSVLQLCNESSTGRNRSNGQPEADSPSCGVSKRRSSDRRRRADSPAAATRRTIATRRRRAASGAAGKTSAPGRHPRALTANQPRCSARRAGPCKEHQRQGVAKARSQGAQAMERPRRASRRRPAAAHVGKQGSVCGCWRSPVRRLGSHCGCPPMPPRVGPTS